MSTIRQSRHGFGLTARWSQSMSNRYEKQPPRHARSFKNLCFNFISKIVHIRDERVAGLIISFPLKFGSRSVPAANGQFERWPCFGVMATSVQYMFGCHPLQHPHCNSEETSSAWGGTLWDISPTSVIIFNPAQSPQSISRVISGVIIYLGLCTDG